MRGTYRSKLRKRPPRARKRNVKVRAYCRRPATLRDFLMRSNNKAKEWGF